MNEQEFENRFRDLLIAHAVYLSRYTTGQARKAVKALNSALSKLESQLASRLVKIKDRGIDMSPASTKVLESKIEEISILIDKAYKPVTDQILDDLRDLAQDEASFTVKAIKTTKASLSTDATKLLQQHYEKAKDDAAKAKADHEAATRMAKVEGNKPPTPPKATKVPEPPKPIRLEGEFPTRSPSPAMVKAVVDTSPMSGRHLKSWAEKLSRDTQEEVARVIRDGMQSAKTTDQIVREIIGTKANRYTDGILQISRNSADAMVRTAISHVHNVAAQIAYAENDDVVNGWRYLSVLDLRTTKFCAAHDGKKYELGKGPIPPNHVRCRSLCQPCTLTMRELGIDVEEATPLTRASMDGPVNGSTKYEQWLKTRTAEEQDTVLGKTLGQKFREGKLTLDDLVNDTRELTLKELRALHPDAF